MGLTKNSFIYTTMGWTPVHKVTRHTTIALLSTVNGETIVYAQPINVYSKTGNGIELYTTDLLCIESSSNPYYLLDGLRFQPHSPTEIIQYTGDKIYKNIKLQYVQDKSPFYELSTGSQTIYYIEFALPWVAVCVSLDCVQSIWVSL